MGIEHRGPAPVAPSVEREKTDAKITFHFDDALYDTAKLVGALNDWWDSICVARKKNPKEKKWHDFGYYLIELGKNALEHAHGGTMEVSFEEDRVTVIVSDQGLGFEDPNEDMLHWAPDHGLSQVKRWADEFSIESNGRKYVKVPRKRKLVSQDSDVSIGSKIIFSKRIV